MRKQEDHEFEASLSYTFKRLAVVSAPEAEVGRVRGQLGPQNNVQNSRGYTEELCLKKQKQKKLLIAQNYITRSTWEKRTQLYKGEHFLNGKDSECLKRNLFSPSVSYLK